MAKKARSKEMRIDSCLKLMVETAALELLQDRWSSLLQPDCLESQVKMEILSHLLQKKLSRKESLLMQVGNSFPDLSEIRWNVREH
ncbi:MAG TPA: hypothetical protein PKA63_09605 [Oligoflexia bacterium]|nr:hypothetical protein [Oligoflexia bacterium]HMP48909.1 hypothetical protein [Oligoflexia bacterium]